MKMFSSLTIMFQTCMTFFLLQNSNHLVSYFNSLRLFIYGWNKHWNISADIYWWPKVPLECISGLKQKMSLNCGANFPRDPWETETNGFQEVQRCMHFHRMDLWERTTSCILPTSAGVSSEIMTLHRVPHQLRPNERAWIIDMLLAV